MKPIVVILFLALATIVQAAKLDAVADSVLGQTSFTETSSGATAQKMNQPRGVAIDPRNGRIYVSDFSNNRVLSWPSAEAFRKGETADVVIGQVSFTGTAANRGFSASGETLSGPAGIAVDFRGTLWVADRGNHRVLGFEEPSLSQTQASYVLGQPAFTSNAANNGGVSASSLNFPADVQVSGLGRVWVADTGNNRVLAFDNVRGTDRVADIVLGQSNFTSNTANSGGLSASSLNAPSAVAIDWQERIFVADQSNNRVLFYAEGDTAATGVFGQANFTSNGPASGGATGLASPTDVFIDLKGDLFVADSASSRILLFESPTSNSVADRVFGQPNLNSATANAGGLGAASLNIVNSIAVDTFGNLYATDVGNQRVLRYDEVAPPTIKKTRFFSRWPLGEFATGEQSSAQTITFNPYPSTISVNGLKGAVTKVNVVLNNVSNTFANDLDIALVGPEGQAVVLMSDSGGSLFQNITLFFDDEGDSVAGPLSNKTYKPTQNGVGDYFPGLTPQDGVTFSTGNNTLSVFNGTDPNGSWQLYVIDDGRFDTGIIGSWGLEIETSGETKRGYLTASYTGILEATPASSSPAENEGFVQITVTSKGGFSGAVKLAGRSFPIKGSLDEDGTLLMAPSGVPSADFLVNGVLMGRFEAVVDLEQAAGRITGTLKNESDEIIAELNSANRGFYSKANPAGVALLGSTSTGTYAALFQHQDAPNNGFTQDAYPQGDGYATAKLTAAGSVRIGGKLADGTAVTFSGLLSKDNIVSAYAPLYKKKNGFISGRIVFNSKEILSDAASFDMKWSKPEQLTDKLYPQGWPSGIGLDFVASKHLAPAKPSAKNPVPLLLLGTHNILGSLAPSAHVLEIFEGDTGDFSENVSLNASQQLTFNTDNTNNAQFKFNTSSGLWTGSFIHPASGKKVSATGIVLQKVHAAAGFFLFFPAGVPGGGLSGGMTLQ